MRRSCVSANGEDRIDGNSDDHFRVGLVMLLHTEHPSGSLGPCLSSSGHVPKWTPCLFRLLIRDVVLPSKIAVPTTTARMKKSNGTTAFDAQTFLDSAGVARRIAEYPKKSTIFAQGDPAKNVMYIQQGGVKLSVVNEALAKKLLLQFWVPAISSAKDVSRRSRSASEPRPRSRRRRFS